VGAISDWVAGRYADRGFRFGYDGNGDRIVASTPDTIQVIPGSAFRELSDFAPGSTVPTGPPRFEALYLAGDTPVARRQVRPPAMPTGPPQAADPAWFSADHLGGTVFMTNRAGAEVAGTRAQYRPYGAFDVQPTSQDSSGHREFTGKELDATGLYDFAARPYDPVTGRFTQADDVDWGTTPQSRNRYAYVLNNPLAMVDSTGNAPDVCAGQCTFANDYITVQKSRGERVFPEIDLTEHPIVLPELDLSGPSPGRGDVSTSDLGGACTQCHPFVAPAPTLAPVERLDIGHPERYIPPELDIGFVRGLFTIATVADTFDDWKETHPVASTVVTVGTIVRGGFGGLRVIKNVNYGALDALGRPTGIKAIITRDMIGTGSSASWRIRPPGFIGEVAGHARGHLLGNQLGGDGRDVRNLVTILQNPVNTPVMSGFEADIRAAVEAGDTVSYKVTPIYRGNELMPIGITLEAKGIKGFSLQTTVLNRP
jgi:RHS repeat-associated protein